MLSPLRNRFGIPGVISVVALVFAMLGGAYAANNSGDGKATASAKAKKGPRGPKGPAGPAGPQGPAGPAGANGKDGANGINGANGATGATGPTGASGAKGATGATGATGETGTPGAPWTAGGTLPVGETETGTWNFYSASVGEFALGYADISFPIPLAAPLDEDHVHFSTRDPDFSDFCTGTVENPTAPSGRLCVYVGVMRNMQPSPEANGRIITPAEASGAGVYGGLILLAQFEEGSPWSASGSFAVTG